MIDITKRGTITSAFGYRDAPTAGATSYHNAVDIVLTDDDVPAVFSGKVVESGYNSARGNYVTIENSDGTRATYKHLASRAVKKGDDVAEGATIGIQGTTGISTGKHLDFSIRTNTGTYVDPVVYLGNFTGDNPTTATDESALSFGDRILSPIFQTVIIVVCVGLAAYFLLKAADMDVKGLIT